MIRTTALALALMLIATTAWPQGRDVAAADALYREARALLKMGDYTAACPKLEESYRLDPAAGTGVNLGDCFEKSGKVASALLAYQAARTLLKPGDPRIGPVEKEISALEKRTPRLAIRLAPGAPEGTEVKRDGRVVEAAKLGSPVVVNPGKHKIVVTAPGREEASFRVTLVEGQTRDLVVEVGEQVDPKQKSKQGRAERADPANSASTDGSTPAMAYVFAGVGLIGLVTGVVTGAVAESKENTASEDCTADKKCNPVAYQAVEDGRTFQAVSYVGWGVGIVGLAAATYFFFIAAPSDGTGTAVGAAATPSSGAVVIKGRF